MCVAVIFQNVPQGCGIIFPTNGVDVTNKFFVRKVVDKNSTPESKIRSLRISIALKLGSKQTKLHKGIHL